MSSTKIPDAAADPPDRLLLAVHPTTAVITDYRHPLRPVSAGASQAILPAQIASELHEEKKGPASPPALRVLKIESGQ